MSSTILRRFAVVATASIMWMVTAAAQAQAPSPYGKAAPFPEPEEELYGVTANGKMVVMGGFGPGGQPPGMVYEYDPATDKWTKKKNMPVPVHHQGEAEYGGKIYMFGGCLKQLSGEGATDNVWEFDPVADSWKALAPMPGKRCSPRAEQVNGKIYVIGGITPMRDGKGTRVVGTNQVYDPATNKWEERSPMPTTRNHAYSGVVNGKIYIIGGRLGTGGGGSPTDVFEEYDPAQDLWGLLKAPMPTPRSGGGSATYNGKIYVAGGELTTRQIATAFRALEAYDPATNEWTLLPSMPVARHGVALAFIGNKLHLVSGGIYPGSGTSGGPGTQIFSAAHDVLEIPVK